MSEVITPPRADRRLFSLHEEEDVVEVPPHRDQIFYLETNLRSELPDRFVGGNMGVYWVPGQFKKPWAGPDVLVSRRPPRDPAPRVYLVWEDGPIQFIAEVASDRTRRTERRKRERIYRVELQVPEYLYIDLDRHQLELWRLQGGEYQRVSDEGGRLFSQELELWFGWDPQKAFVRIWTPEGRMLLTAEEQRQRLEEAEQQAQEERQRRQEEQEQRQAAEQRAQEEQRQRQEAEQRAQEERRLREEAEARAAALAAELERLRGD
jgi:Uma2 family endonuclease